MKKRFPFVVVLLFQSILVQAQLKWLNPLPSGITNNKIVFTNRTDGFIFNEDGVLMRTTDQGANWKVARRFASMYAFDLADSTGVIAGYGGTLYISTDNGNTWQSIYTSVFKSRINAADIVSRDTVFLSTSSEMYKSFDRGKTWQTMYLPYSTTVSCFEFVNSQIGFIGKNLQSILRTIDGGLTWQETAISNVSPSRINAIKFLNKDTGYACREFRTLLKTIDGGINWTSTDVHDESYSICFPTNTTGYIVGVHGTMYRTDNAGTSWSWIGPLGRKGGYDLRAVYFINADTGFATGLRGRILKTVDRGDTWKSYSCMYDDISDLDFPNPATGYAASGSTLYKTTDSSKSWSILPIQSSEYGGFQKVHFFSKDTGIVASSKPAFVHITNDGGITWQYLNPSNYYAYDNASDLSFINDSTGFILITTYYNSLISKTKNRGETWKGIDSARYSGEQVYKIHFLNEQTGFALRYSQLYKTTDSAKTWTLVKDNNSYKFNCLWFIDERIGMLGDGSGLNRTTDGGATWNPIDITYSDREILNIKFLTGSVGFITCSSGAIYQTADSGSTWSLYSKAGASNITFNKQYIYFSGALGTIKSSAVNYIVSNEYKCANGNSTSFVSDLSGNSYVWQASSDSGKTFVPLTDDFFYSGTQTKTLTLKYTFQFLNGTIYRCVVDGNMSNPFYLKFQSRWTGAADNSWENPSNWSCYMVPGYYDDVLIGNGDIVVHSNVSVRSLTLLAGVTVTVLPGYQVTVTH